MTPMYMQQTTKRVMFSESCSEFSVLWRRDVSAGTQKSMKIRLRPSTFVIDFGQNVPFINHVKYLGVIFHMRNTWRPRIEMIDAEAFGTFIRIHSLFKSELLSSSIKLTYQKGLIRLVMTYACPTWELAPANQHSSQHWKFCPWFAHDIQLSIFLQLYNKIVQAASISHMKSW
jgi:hypothetical protein